MPDFIKSIVDFWGKVKALAVKVWAWICHAASYFNDPRTGKASPRRVIGVVLVAVAIRQLVIHDYWGALVAAVTAAVLIVLALVKKT